ncbi:hypothetical protein FMN50_01640 [Rhodobacterales bacterium]|nr:hypothetical protein FMN50_01640 [Rhodobacterales bacterium]
MPIGLVLGGGAPNLPLMSGALLALDEAGLDFKVISTTGAGMVAGLLYASPQKPSKDDDLVETRRTALKATQFMGIDDIIYRFMPINYKVFQKPGPFAVSFAPTFNDWFLKPNGEETPAQRFTRDWWGLVAATLTPSNLSMSSKGLCQAPSWIEAMVDFDGLVENLGDTRFRLTAYCVDDRKDVTFHRDDITIDHCKAALAMPFIYEPFKLTIPGETKPKTFLEGSAFNPLEFNPGDVMVENDIDTIIFLDVLGYRELIDEPKELIDAWVQSIIAPLTRLAENSLAEFKRRREVHANELYVREMQKAAESASGSADKFRAASGKIEKRQELYKLVDMLGCAEAGLEVFADRADAHLAEHDDEELREVVDMAKTQHEDFAVKREQYLKRKETELLGRSAPKSETHRSRTELLRMPFEKHIPQEYWPNVLDWSHSNMTRLFKIGYETGQAFVQTHRSRIESSLGRKLSETEFNAAEAAE